jgi:hypothetical protein
MQVRFLPGRFVARRVIRWLKQNGKDGRVSFVGRRSPCACAGEGRLDAFELGPSKPLATSLDSTFLLQMHFSNTLG